MAKCKIQWIDSEGKPTPDTNDAVAIVNHHESIWKCPTGCPDNRIIGWKDKVAQSFPICADHLAQFHKDLLNGKGWSLSPLPEGEEN